MQFVSYRVLRNTSGVIKERLKEDGYLVITGNGEPFAVMLTVSPDDLEETLLLLKRLRAQQAVSAMRAEAARRGLQHLDAATIEAEVQATHHPEG